MSDTTTIMLISLSNGIALLLTLVSFWMFSPRFASHEGRTRMNKIQWAITSAFILDVLFGCAVVFATDFSVIGILFVLMLWLVHCGHVVFFRRRVFGTLTD